MGDRKNFIPDYSEARERLDKTEIVAVVPLKAERTPVPGAGFSPEAVPGKAVERKIHQTPSVTDWTSGNEQQHTLWSRRNQVSTELCEGHRKADHATSALQLGNLLSP
jgi:hypothetical protein